ncbi:MAG: hypothetical protein G01um101472_134, partial [Parcubacteria group bacterium Gr01-1014_72]
MHFLHSIFSGVLAVSIFIQPLSVFADVPIRDEGSGGSASGIVSTPTPSISVLAPEGVSVMKGTYVLFSWSTANVPADWKIMGRLIEHDPRGTSHFTLFENLPTSAASFTAAIPNIPAGRYVFNISACAPT